MRLMSRFLQYAAPLAVLPGQAVAEGMPQFHFKDSLVQGQVIWGIVIFLVFYFILSRSALPRVADTLRQRHDRIQNDLDLARRTREAAKKAQKERSAARRAASDKAQATIQAIKESSRKEMKAQAESTARRLEDEIRRAEDGIASMREKALSHLDEITVQTADTIMERLIGQQDVDALRRAVAGLQK